MKRRKFIPSWLKIVDTVYVICYVLAFLLGKLPSILNSILSIIFCIPIFIADNLLWPVIILNIAIILLKILNKKKSNTSRTDNNRSSAITATIINRTPNKDTVESAYKGHMDLF